jgi:lipopolysaccharide export system permease protein
VNIGGTIDRYLWGQIFRPALVALVSLNLLFLVVQLIKVGEIAFGAGLGWSDLILVSFLFLPGFAVLTIPVSVLVGVLLGFGRMAEDNEMTALHAAGISTARLVIVPALIGAVAGLLAGFIAVSAAPWATEHLHQTFVSLAKKHLVSSLHPGRFFEEVPRLVLYPRRAGDHDGEFNGFMMFDRRPGRTPHILLAAKARIRPVGDGNSIHLDLEEGEVHAREKRRYTSMNFGQAQVDIDIDQLVQQRTRFISPVDRLTLGELAQAAADGDLSSRDRNRHLAAMHRRFAFPVAALVFALVGTAIGVGGRLRGRRRTLVAAVLAVVVYYLTMRLGDGLVDKAILSPGLSAWGPDCLMALGAVFWMWWRSRRPG